MMKQAQTATAVPNKMITVEEVMDILQVGRSTAYHTMQRLNKELRDKGYITHPVQDRQAHQGQRNARPFPKSNI